MADQLRQENLDLKKENEMLRKILTFMRSRHRENIRIIEEKDRIIEAMEREITDLYVQLDNRGETSQIPSPTMNFDVHFDCEIDREFDDDPLNFHKPSTSEPRFEVNETATKSNFECDICGKQFDERLKIYNHVRTHVKYREFQCSQCPQAFKFGDALRRHEVVHTNLKPHKCSECEKSFNTKKNLRQHEKFVHSDERRFECGICFQKFKMKSTLKTHEQTHSMEKNFVCQVCQKSFKTSTSLKMHEIYHQEEKKFECEICEKRFYTKSDLTKHSKRHK